ncbi:MAG: nodulation protein NfeD [candidate division Zixibacteria bacterium]|nr:nodulation protein NfeD [candidate division Zixibacteria bacterium]
MNIARNITARATRAAGNFARKLIGEMFLAVMLLCLTASVLAEGVARVRVDMAIGPISVKVIDQAVDRASEEGRDLLIIQMDTPGGLDQSMRATCRKLLNSDLPTIVYVAPPGARAASAGLFIAYAANLIAMAPGTNIGAAHVVNMGGKMDSVMTDKVQNDAAAYITSIAKKRGRNVDWARRAVLESVSIDAQAALDSGVINILAKDMDDLLAQLEGKVVDLPAGPDTLHVAGKEVVEYALSFKDRFLKIITDPTIAFILFNLGWLGLMVELYNPGAILPGVVGVISLIMAFFAFQQLPINYAGLGLIIFAVILFILEIKIVSHGILAVGGVLSMLMGSLLLIDSPAPYLQISLTVIVTTVLVVSAFFLFVVSFAVKAHRRKVTTGMEGMVGQEGEMRTAESAFVAGELWRVVCDTPLAVGDKVKVLAVDNMRLKVEKIGGRS